MERKKDKIAKEDSLLIAEVPADLVYFCYVCEDDGGEILKCAESNCLICVHLLCMNPEESCNFVIRKKYFCMKHKYVDILPYLNINAYSTTKPLSRVQIEKKKNDLIFGFQKYLKSHIPIDVSINVVGIEDKSNRKPLIAVQLYCPNPEEDLRCLKFEVNEHYCVFQDIVKKYGESDSDLMYFIFLLLAITSPRSSDHALKIFHEGLFNFVANKFEIKLEKKKKVEEQPVSRVRLIGLEPKDFFSAEMCDSWEVFKEERINVSFSNIKVDSEIQKSYQLMDKLGSLINKLHTKFDHKLFKKEIKKSTELVSYFNPVGEYGVSSLQDIDLVAEKSKVEKRNKEIRDDLLAFISAVNEEIRTGVLDLVQGYKSEISSLFRCDIKFSENNKIKEDIDQVEQLIKKLKIFVNSRDFKEVRTCGKILDYKSENKGLKTKLNSLEINLKEENHEKAKALKVHRMKEKDVLQELIDCRILLVEGGTSVAYLNSMDTLRESKEEKEKLIKVKEKVIREKEKIIEEKEKVINYQTQLLEAKQKQIRDLQFLLCNRAELRVSLGKKVNYNVDGTSNFSSFCNQNKTEPYVHLLENEENKSSVCAEDTVFEGSEDSSMEIESCDADIVIEVMDDGFLEFGNSNRTLSLIGTKDENKEGYTLIKVEDDFGINTTKGKRTRVTTSLGESSDEENLSDESAKDPSYDPGYENKKKGL